MLSQLSVKNLAVVEKLDLSFDSGMSAVTGETGAGKSILLQALSLALGARADSSLVRHGKDKADISVVFAVENNQSVQNFLQAQSLDDEGECILRRVITSDGRSKAFINGNSVPLSAMRSVGELLIDMHGQNEHQLLLRNDQQMNLLDSYAQLDEQKTELNTTVKRYKELKEKIDYLRDNHDLAQAQQTLLTHQLDELNQAQLSENELNNIESDFKISSNAQSLMDKTSEILNQLDNDNGINHQLSALAYELGQALELDTKLESAHELLNSAQVQTQEAIYELNHYLSSLSIDEQSAQEIELRVSELHELARKHNAQIIELMDVKQNIENELEKITTGNHSIDELTTQLEELEKQYMAQATSLSTARVSYADKLSSQVTQAMQVLGMPGSEFKIGLNTKPDGVHLNGVESVEFLVKTNMGQAFKALKKVASGGELSRISLALSVVSSNSEYTPTLIFDEVDVGISGAVAQVVGEKLQELAAHYQVICITHLAQVASFGHQHLRVSKAQLSDGVQTQVVQLSESDRVDEIARILGGAVITDKTRVAAAEMIAQSCA